MIRDKEGIYTALLQSQSMNRQLAVCFSEEGKLLVKICAVSKIIGRKEGVRVVLRSQGEEEEETIIALDRIQSIYPIRDFV